MRASFLRSLWIKIYSALITIRISLLVIYYSIFHVHNARQRTDKLAWWWAARLLRAIRLNYTFHDPYHLALQPGKRYIIMCNHCSFYDIPLSFLAIRCSMRMITKKELFRVPIWGTAMKFSEFVPIDRQNRKKAIEQLRHAAEKLSSGIVLWIAPEGTRSKTGTLGPLKKGGFKLAAQVDAEIIPLRIEGANRLYDERSGRFLLNQHVDMTIGQAINVRSYRDNEPALIETVAARLKPENRDF
ncbi:MAG: lysophospholipid acyltransferase family protein [Pseudomonadota bacterium]